MRLSTAILIGAAVFFARMLPSTGSLIGEIAVAVGIGAVVIGTYHFARHLGRRFVPRFAAGGEVTPMPPVEAPAAWEDPQDYWSETAQRRRDAERAAETTGQSTPRFGPPRVAPGQYDPDFPAAAPDHIEPWKH